MNIVIRRTGRYAQVALAHDGTTISLGLLDYNEQLDFARQLLEAADSALPGGESTEKASQHICEARAFTIAAKAA